MTPDRRRAARPSSSRRAAVPSPTPRLTLHLLIECPDWRTALPKAKTDIARWMTAALATAGLGGAAEINLLLGNDARLKSLNHSFRGKAKPTNVLSFPAQTGRVRHLGEKEPLMLGDVAMAYETITREAMAQGKTFTHHVAHLAIHGLLHCLGHDHEHDGQALIMETLERRTLDRFGLPDPYAPPQKKLAKKAPKKKKL